VATQRAILHRRHRRRESPRPTPGRRRITRGWSASRARNWARPPGRSPASCDPSRNTACRTQDRQNDDADRHHRLGTL